MGREFILIVYLLLTLAGLVVILMEDGNSKLRKENDRLRRENKRLRAQLSRFLEEERHG